MQLKFFTIPILATEEEEERLNKFLASVKLLEIKRELVTLDGNAYWAICVIYLQQKNQVPAVSGQKEKVDYKTLLTENEFNRFCQLRKIRKQLADKDAVPAYAVFTDYELSEISRMDEINVTRMKSISGIGVKKIEKYGNIFCELVAEILKNETSG